LRLYVTSILACQWQCLCAVCYQLMCHSTQAAISLVSSVVCRCRGSTGAGLVFAGCRVSCAAAWGMTIPYLHRQRDVCTRTVPLLALWGVRCLFMVGTSWLPPPAVLSSAPRGVYCLIVRYRPSTTSFGQCETAQTVTTTRTSSGALAAAAFFFLSCGRGWTIFFMLALLGLQVV